MNITDLLKAHGKSVTEERKILYDGMGAVHLFRANDLCKKFPNISRASIFRTIVLFNELGIIRKLSLDGGGEYYELTQNPHHEHFECQKCHSIFRFDAGIICKSLGILAKKQGFHLLQHQIQLSGTCSHCFDNNI